MNTRRTIDFSLPAKEFGMALAEQYGRDFAREFRRLMKRRPILSLTITVKKDGSVVSKPSSECTARNKESKR